MEFDKHPISVIKEIIEMYYEPLKKEHDSDLMFEYSKYVDGVNGTLSRQVFKIRPKMITNRWLAEKNYSLKKNEEIGFHSRVYVGDKIFHIPMIDFIGKDLKKIKEIMKGKGNFTLFNSGNSYHAYFTELVEEIYWMEFLMNLFELENRDKIHASNIDIKWLGHSIVDGCCILRWSNNTKLCFPSKI